VSVRARLVAGVAAVLALVPAVAPAHPHVFIDYSIVFLVGPRGPESVRIEWTFDEVYSSMLLKQYDADRDGVFSPRELQVLEEKHFRRLGEDHYFLELKAAGRSVPVAGVREFQAKAGRGSVSYGFTVPLPGLDADQGVVEVLLEDAEYYVAFAAVTPPARFEAPATYQVDCALATGDTESIRCRYRRR
jgi:ABC-type uncharacterized transport system substrate-binding protein